MKFFLFCMLFWNLLGFAMSLAEEYVDGDVKMTKTVAILKDGPSVYFDGLVNGFLKELEPIADEQYNLEIKDSYNAGYDFSQIKHLLAELLNDPEVDVIYCAGIASSQYALSLPVSVRTKPILAGAVDFSYMSSERVDAEGFSKLPNITFIQVPDRVETDLTILRDISGTQEIYSFLDPIILDGFGGALQEEVKRLNHKLGVQINILPIGSSADAAIKALPDSARAVYLPIIPRFSDAERLKLIKKLIKKKVITVSILGSREVEQGVMAGLATDQRQATYRRTALNLHQMILGVPTELMPVFLQTTDQFTINMETANAVGWSPDYDTVLSADLINEDSILQGAESLSLYDALGKAQQLNPEIKAQVASLRNSAAEYEVSRSNYGFKLNGTGQLGASGTHDAINTLLSPRHAESGSLGLEVSKLLYSDRMSSILKSQVEIVEASKWDYESVVLDVILNTAHGYFDCLQAEANYQIQKENLHLTQNNKALASLRYQIGATKKTDIFRWKALEAQAKANLMQADSNRKLARTSLNSLIASPRSKQWVLDQIILGEGQVYFMDDELERIVDTDEECHNFQQFLSEYAVHNSPELRSFDRTLRAQGILLKERGRRTWMPEAQLTASASHVLQSAANVDRDSQSEWTVGVGFTIPFGEGGLKKAEKKSIQAVIDQLYAQRENALFLVEQNALSSGYQIGASHSSLRLSRQAEEASQKNYDSVSAQYSEGAVGITDLLDAQSDLISQRQSVVNNNYQFLKDIFSLQRSIAWFEYTKSEEEKEKFKQQLLNYFKTKSIHIRVGG